MKPSSRSMRKAQREKFEAKRSGYCLTEAEQSVFKKALLRSVKLVDDAPYHLQDGTPVFPDEPWQTFVEIERK